MISGTTQNVELEHGMYHATLVGANMFLSPNYNTGELELNVSLELDLDGKPHYDAFITIPTDDAGLPRMAGSKSKLYNRLSALYGERFDPKAVGKTLTVEYALPEQYDSPEGLRELPTWDDIDTGAKQRVPVTIRVNAIDLMGRRCLVEIGNMQKPDGTMSKRTSVVTAMPLPKGGNTAKQAA